MPPELSPFSDLPSRYWEYATPIYSTFWAMQQSLLWMAIQMPRRDFHPWDRSCGLVNGS